MTVLADLRSRLRGHTCYDGCADLVCMAAREIERLHGQVSLMRFWVCPHRSRMEPDRGNDDTMRQCADCAGIIYSPERIALERAERAEALLRRLAEPTGYLFRNPDADNAAGQWSESAMKRVWSAACESVGVEVSLYEGTKHTFATALTSAGVERRVVATILGHADERSADRYARLQPEVIRSALGRIPK